MKPPFSFHGTAADKMLGAMQPRGPHNPPPGSTRPGPPASLAAQIASVRQGFDQLKSDFQIIESTSQVFAASYGWGGRDSTYRTQWTWQMRQLANEARGIAWQAGQTIDVGPIDSWSPVWLSARGWDGSAGWRPDDRFVAAVSGAISQAERAVASRASRSTTQMPAIHRNPSAAVMRRPPGLAGPRSLGDAASAATDAQMQMVGLASFFAGVNAGQAPNPTQLAAAMTAVQNMQNDLVAMGATPPSANTVGGVTKIQAAGIGVGSALLGVLIDRAVK